MDEETKTTETKCPGTPHRKHVDMTLNCYLDGNLPDFIRHMKPLPVLTDWARSGEDVCPARVAAVSPRSGRITVWHCTRAEGHPGKHEAGGMGQMKHAEWGTE